MMGGSPYASSRSVIAGNSIGGRGSVVDGTKRGVKHRRARKHNYAMHINSSSTSAASLLVLLALSCCASHRTTTVEAFVGVTVTTSGTRRAGFRCTDDRLIARSTTLPERRSRTSPPLLRSRSSFARGSVAPAAAASSAASSSFPPSLSSAATDGASTTDGGGVVADAGQKESTDDKKERLIRVNTLAEMTELLSQGKSLFDLDARGDSQEMLEARQDVHPVLEVLTRRAAAGTKPGSHGDGLKVVNVLLLPCVVAVTTHTAYLVVCFVFSCPFMLSVLQPCLSQLLRVAGIFEQCCWNGVGADSRY